MKILYELTEEDVDIYLNAEDIHLTTDQKATLLSKLEEEFSALDEFHQAIDGILEDMSEAPDFSYCKCANCGRALASKEEGIEVHDEVFEFFVVCSTDCKKKFHAKVEKNLVGEGFA